MDTRLITLSPESEISSSEWLMLNQFLHEIKQINTTCVSVYYPYGKGPEIVSLLEEAKRNQSIESIESEIEKRIAYLRENPSSVGKFAKTLYFWMGREWQSYHQRNWNLKKTAICIHDQQKTFSQTL